ncbi:MAG: type II toxin-antitoxin system HicB family antitoxin, partial [Ktedonobacterales bacterium]
MFAEYLQAAMRHAVYEQVEDGTYYGSIPGFRGVIANEATLEAMRTELLEV